jgi:tRNA threonylcarbamoyl adenosine modification protein YeaZ
MKILAFDTSSKLLTAAVTQDNKVIKQVNRCLKKPEHNRLLLKTINRLLEESKIKLSDIDVVSVGRGPGSFTGLRIGLATAKGLTFESQRKLTGLSSFDAAAFNIKEKGKLIVVIEDARKDMVYSCIYLNDDLGCQERITDYQLLSFKDFCTYVSRLAKKYKKDIIFTKDGIVNYKQELKKRFKRALFANENKWLPKAANLALLTYNDLKLTKSCLNKKGEIEPLYLHSQYANITRPKKI